VSVAFGSVAEFRMILGDSGVAVVQGGISVLGLKDYGDVLAEGESGFGAGYGGGSQSRGEVIGRQIVVTVLTADFAAGNLSIGAVITVDGVNYAIRDAREYSQLGLPLTNLYLGAA
jgi:hypothetical protein